MGSNPFLSNFIKMQAKKIKPIAKNLDSKVPKKFKNTEEKSMNKIFLTKAPSKVIKNKVFSIVKTVSTNKDTSNKDLYKKILGTITKKGKKNIAKKALNHSLYITSRLYRISSYKILPSLLKNLKCYAEIKKVVRRKNIN